jgi:hypothetical protein
LIASHVDADENGMKITEADGYTPDYDSYASIEPRVASDPTMAPDFAVWTPSSISRHGGGATGWTFARRKHEMD